VFFIIVIIKYILEIIKTIKNIDLEHLFLIKILNIWENLMKDRWKVKEFSIKINKEYTVHGKMEK
jgi:hypothetical protein